ncbi:hypothetical protein [Radicibacter daui]|uniref:hypothetical protein n=1 Tax=Radicibacter daui TaxID=3064829 RepID=UPI004046B214
MASAGPFVDRVHTVAGRLGDVHVALAEGYTALPCASGMEGGSMGIHYVNQAYLADDTLDLSRPEAVMYEPQPDGSLQLVGAEYITFKGPANLGGHLFNFVTAPNRYGLDPYYELHVWAWRTNPRGPFADMNPDVSCIWAAPGGESSRSAAKSRMGVP